MNDRSEGKGPLAAVKCAINLLEEVLRFWREGKGSLAVAKCIVDLLEEGFRFSRDRSMRKKIAINFEHVDVG